MKKLLSLLVSFSILLSIGALLSQGAYAENGDEAAGDTDKPKLSDRCTEVLEKGQCCYGITDKECKKKCPDVEGKVTVILSESIKSGGKGYRCSEIVYCVREKTKKEEKQDMAEIAMLTTKYQQCIIGGKEGLDLLNNYAALVYQWIAGIVGAISILVIIISGIQISIGGLSQEAISTAKDRIVRSLVGLVVLFLSAFILYTINPVFFT